MADDITLGDIARALGLVQNEAESAEPVLSEHTLDAIVERISQGRANNIIVMSGAGMSTSAGIPDFRSPHTGLYSRLQGKYDLPDPQAIFEIAYFRRHPEPFFELCKDLAPNDIKPTPCHYFVRLLHEKGLLLRTYTQNIDALDHLAGIPAEKIVEAHGSYHKSSCLECGKKYDSDWLKAHVAAGSIPHCELESCGALVKPDVVFFGEALPTRFFSLAKRDFPQCDLLIIIGTSLVVFPFASLAEFVGGRTPRLLLNRDRVGQGMLDFDEDNNMRRDVFWQGTCDDGARLLADKLGWKEDLDKLINGTNRNTEQEPPPKEDTQQAKQAATAASCQDKL